MLGDKNPMFFRSAVVRCPSGWPQTVAVPASGAKSEASIRINVVFPAPLGPRRPTIEPTGTSNEIGCTADDPVGSFVALRETVYGNRRALRVSKEADRCTGHRRRQVSLHEPLAAAQHDHRIVKRVREHSHPDASGSIGENAETDAEGHRGQHSGRIQMQDRKHQGGREHGLRLTDARIAKQAEE